MSTFYIPRRLYAADIYYSETGLLDASRHIIILAEPGGGKTDLLKSLASQLNTTVFSANSYLHKKDTPNTDTLLIDALDELVRVDTSGILNLLGKASGSQADRIILSSRSSEWDEAWSYSFADFFGQKPLVVRLSEFNEIEQKSLFENHTHGLDFFAFQNEVARFNLDVLLPNPQFLKLFADAYIESNSHFVDKESIFQLAIEHLAKEVNPRVVSHGSISTDKKVELASEIFAKLLLSGAEGVSKRELSADRWHPALASIVEREFSLAGVLATRLFKPGTSNDQHLPVHKIVSEYCAAKYIVERISNSNDPLRLSSCLPVIAPNSTVRDELRGMLGWMATLGDISIQEAVIDLDPYAVLANGDPSQLAQSTKLKLVHNLKKLAKDNPQFRRGDFRRKFSITGFFTENLVNEIKALLTAREEHSQLRSLILELLVSSKETTPYTSELSQILREPQENGYIRELASYCLLEIEEYDHQSNLDELKSEASNDSLKIAAIIMERLGPEKLENSYLIQFLNECAKLYSSEGEPFERMLGTWYFIKCFAARFDIEMIEFILDELTHDLSCSCGKEHYECQCRYGISKVSGILIDLYFEKAPTLLIPVKIWAWMKNLHFRHSISEKSSIAVRIMQQDDGLRQSTIKVAFDNQYDPGLLYQLKLKFVWGEHSHSGLQFKKTDYLFIVDHAFKTKNVALWKLFIATHRYYVKKSDAGPNKLRKLMKSHALESNDFMKAWSIANSHANKDGLNYLGQQRKFARRDKKRKKNKIETNTSNINYISDNRELVESGKHWPLLVDFSRLTLMRPALIEEMYGDEELARSALRNCLDHIESVVPNLLKLAELQCASKNLESERVLYAACVEIFRTEGNLAAVKQSLLQALRTNINTSYEGVTDDEREGLRAEIDKLLFPSDKEVEIFLRNYIEPQLRISECNNPSISWFRDDKAFCHFQKTLPIDWLDRFPDVPVHTLGDLFELSAQHGDRKQLERIIEKRCNECLRELPTKIDIESLEEHHKFWFVRGLFFLAKLPTLSWDWLAKNKNNILDLRSVSGQFHSIDRPYWPTLTSSKVSAILNHFISSWPKVDLSDSIGPESPVEQLAYRYLTEIIWAIESDDPDESLAVLDELLADPQYVDFHHSLKSIRATQSKKKSLSKFTAPEPKQIVKLLDQCHVVTVEGLRALLVEELGIYQSDLNGSDTTSKGSFYSNYKEGIRLDEVTSTLRIADRVRLRLERQGVLVVVEHQLNDEKRCDFTCTKMIDNQQKLLVIEVKGQWHKDLYTAASEQLFKQYSRHPNAEKQGIYLVLWFGEHEKVAARKCRDIENAEDLKLSIEKTIPSDLKGLIDVYVLDVSKTGAERKQ